MLDRSFHAPQPLIYLFLASLLILSACASNPQAATPSPTSEPPAPATHTPTDIPPTASHTPTEDVQPEAAPPSETVAPLQLATATLPATEPTCVVLRDPEDGASLPAFGWWTFAWDAWPGAASYLLDITTPTGWVLSVQTVEPSGLRALEALKSGGEYSWVVSALDANGVVLCQAGPHRFNKPEYQASAAPGEPPDLGPPPDC